MRQLCAPRGGDVTLAKGERISMLYFSRKIAEFYFTPAWSAGMPSSEEGRKSSRLLAGRHTCCMGGADAGIRCFLLHDVGGPFDIRGLS